MIDDRKLFRIRFGSLISNWIVNHIRQNEWMSTLFYDEGYIDLGIIRIWSV